MTPLATTIELGRAFKASSSNTAYLQKLERHHRKERQDRERKDVLAEEAADVLDAMLVMVTSEEVAAFKVELTAYETATVIALQENERGLARVRERLAQHFSQAHVLPDGRRVFKTMDGQRVFDENGQELALDVIEPDLIADHRPRWEHVKSDIDLEKSLHQERQELLNYQGKLDGARERVDHGDITRAEYDQMQDDLKTSMPDAVRRHVPGMDQDVSLASDAPSNGPSVSLDISANAVPGVRAPMFGFDR